MPLGDLLRDMVGDGFGTAHFDRLANHLESSLKELELPKDEIKIIIHLLETCREDVLGSN